MSSIFLLFRKMTNNVRGEGVVNLQLLRTTSSSLERVISSFYGPQCSQTLMTSSTGKAVVTCDGYTLLQSINATHPVSSIVTKAIDRCHSYSYDGCKTFIIYLSRFISLAEIDIISGKLLPHGSNLRGNMQVNEQQGKLYVSKCLRKIQTEVMPLVYYKVIEFCQRACDKKRSIHHTLKCVARTTLMPHFNPKLVDFLTDCLGKLIDIGEDLKNLRNSLQFLIKNFSCMCIRSPSQPYDRSTIIPSYIIQREFTLECDSKKEPRPVNIVMITTAIDTYLDHTATHETIKISSGSQLNESLICRIKHVRCFVDSCTKLDINVVLCSEGVPQFALDIFRARGISVVHYVLKEDIRLLEALTSTLAVTSINDLEKHNILTANSVRSISINGRNCVQVQVESSFSLNQIILCAPTIGLCDQLYLIVQKAVKAMTLCLQSEDVLQYTNYSSEIPLNLCLSKVTDYQNDSHTSESEGDNFMVQKAASSSRYMDFGGKNSKAKENYLDGYTDGYTDCLVVPGGGGFEQLVAHYLKVHVASDTDSDIRNVCNLIGESIMHILNILYRNTSERSKDKHAHIEIHHQLMEKLNQNTVLGLNRRGQPVDMLKAGFVVEPVITKIHTLNCVLALIEQLFRIDKIVSVRKHSSDSERHSSDSEQHE